MTPVSVMSGSLGDIFWDLPPWITYAPGFDLGCSIYVANPTALEKEYALMARLYRGETLVSEESVPVFGYAWFKVAPEDFIRLRGALRFDETDADVVVLLVERETEEVTDSAVTRLMAPQASGALPPAWPGAPGTSAGGFDWSSMLGLILPIMMIGMMLPALKPNNVKEEIRVVAKEENKQLTSGRQE